MYDLIVLVISLRLCSFIPKNSSKSEIASIIIITHYYFNLCNSRSQTDRYMYSYEREIPTFLDLHIQNNFIHLTFCLQIPPFFSFFNSKIILCNKIPYYFSFMDNSPCSHNLIQIQFECRCRLARLHMDTRLSTPCSCSIYLNLFTERNKCT